MKGEPALPLKKDIDYIELIHAIARCRGEVFCRVKDGNINMKSALSQYVVIFSISNPSLMEQAELICEDDTDYERLAAYLEIS